MVDEIHAQAAEPGPAERPELSVKVLGPVELVADGRRRVPVAAAKRRAVLAVLALELNRLVPTERLLELVWDGDPPAHARGALHGHVAALRRLLAEGRGLALTTLERGYILAGTPDRVDAGRFARLAALAEQADGDLAVALLRQALALWRGDALMCLPAGLLRDGVGMTLERSRLRVLSSLAERFLGTGHAGEVLPELRRAAAANPLCESLARLTMLALAQSGQRTEALSVYSATRVRLGRELGAEPGPELLAAHQAVLRGTLPAGDVYRAPSRAGHRLPRPACGQTGRSSELAWLSRQRDGGTPAVVVAGRAGVGKTALVLRWAQLAAPHFPDGRVFVDAGGSRKAEPGGDAPIVHVLGELGVAGTAMPKCPNERGALLRTLTADLRLLLVLDDVADAEQVRPLLTVGPGCFTVMTARRRPAGPTAGVGFLALGALSEAESWQLLAQTVGPDRLEADPPAARLLIELCERMPPSLRSAAARLAARPRWTVRTLVDVLAGERGELDGPRHPADGSNPGAGAGAVLPAARPGPDGPDRAPTVPAQRRPAGFRQPAASARN